MFLTMWKFVGFLGMIILILVLFAIIFALVDTIIGNIKVSTMRTALIKEINNKIEKGNFGIMSEEELKNNGIPNNIEEDK